MKHTCLQTHKFLDKQTHANQCERVTDRQTHTAHGFVVYNDAMRRISNANALTHSLTRSLTHLHTHTHFPSPFLHWLVVNAQTKPAAQSKASGCKAKPKVAMAITTAMLA